MEEMSLEQHIKNLKDYIKYDVIIEKDNSDFAQFCKNHCEDIQTVLNELDNRIPRENIFNKINEFIEKSLLDIEETEKFKFEHTLDELYAIKYGVIHVLNELLNKE